MKGLQGQWTALLLISVAVVLTLSTWFSATAVSNDIRADFAFSKSQIAWLTNAVQLGFVVSALVSSFFALADVLSMRILLTVGAVFAGLSNAVILLEPSATTVIFSRFLTGASLALVYPTAMKFIGTWFVSGRGLAMGTVVGALTLGSALPHLVQAIGVGVDWRLVITVTSLACLVAAIIFMRLQVGPHQFKAAPFKFGHFKEVLKNKAAMLANIGYFGHMWELYAFWGWLLAYITAAQASGLSIVNTSLITFSAIAMGSIGCLVAGWLADRIGRCFTCIAAMVLSGICSIAIGFVFDGPVLLFMFVVLLWGFSTVADSAQFSAAVSEVSDPGLVGASLAFQMGVGFSITLAAVWLVPEIVQLSGGWQWSFLVLAIGPIIGVGAMLMLRSHPDAVKIANGMR